MVIHAKAGETICLDASHSKDPDGDIIQFLWWQQPEIGTAKLTIDNAESNIINVRMGTDGQGVVSS